MTEGLSFIIEKHTNSGHMPASLRFLSFDAIPTFYLLNCWMSIYLFYFSVVCCCSFCFNITKLAAWPSAKNIYFLISVDKWNERINREPKFDRSYEISQLNERKSLKRTEGERERQREKKIRPANRISKYHLICRICYYIPFINNMIENDRESEPYEPHDVDVEIFHFGPFGDRRSTRT